MSRKMQGRLLRASFGVLFYSLHKSSNSTTLWTLLDRGLEQSMAGYLNGDDEGAGKAQEESGCPKYFQHTTY